MWVQNKIELMSIDCVAMSMAAQNQDAGCLGPFQDAARRAAYPDHPP